MAYEMGVSSMDDFLKRQTFAASPAEPGVSLIGLDEVIECRNDPMAYRTIMGRPAAGKALASALKNEQLLPRGIPTLLKRNQSLGDEATVVTREGLVGRSRT
jgi:hypothetical protein